MRSLYILILSSLLLGCAKKQDKNYEQAMEDCLKNSRQFKMDIKTITKSFESCLIGIKIPTFHAKTMEGRDINLEYFNGKITVINFWFITCEPCVAEIPGLNLIVDKFGKEEINYLAIGRDKELDIKEFLQQHPWKFDQITEGSDIMAKIFKLRMGYPTTYILNKNTEIIYSSYGGQSDSLAVQEIQSKLNPIIQNSLKDR
ncbi:MAG: TlpA disulfide reductase family protein [Saprospiraceae bacterium]